MSIVSFFDYNKKVIEGGQSHSFYFRKVSFTTNITTAGVWVDTSMYPGTPPSNYYASTPLAASLLDPPKGFQLPLTDDTRYLKSWTFSGVGVAGTYSAMLLDYLMYYPFIDGEDLSTQVLDNTISLPSRGNNGDGVQMFLVAQGGYLGNVNCEITYTNSVGKQQVLNPVRINSVGGFTATVANAGLSGLGGFFIPLTLGDKGVRKVDSVRLLDSAGGVFALVLAKPIASTVTYDINSSSEKDFLISGSMPILEPDCFLGMLVASTGNITTAVSFNGKIQVVWG